MPHPKAYLAYSQYHQPKHAPFHANKSLVLNKQTHEPIASNPVTLHTSASVLTKTQNETKSNPNSKVTNEKTQGKAYKTPPTKVVSPIAKDTAPQQKPKSNATASASNTPSQNTKTLTNATASNHQANKTTSSISQGAVSIQNAKPMENASVSNTKASTSFNLLATKTLQNRESQKPNSNPTKQSQIQTQTQVENQIVQKVVQQAKQTTAPKTTPVSPIKTPQVSVEKQSTQMIPPISKPSQSPQKTKSAKTEGTHFVKPKANSIVRKSVAVSKITKKPKTLNKKSWMANSGYPAHGGYYPGISAFYRHSLHYPLHSHQYTMIPPYPKVFKKSLTVGHPPPAIHHTGARLWSMINRHSIQNVHLKGCDYKKSGNGKSLILNKNHSTKRQINPTSETVLKSLRQKIEKVQYVKSGDGKKLVKVVQVNPVSLAKQKVKLSLFKVRRTNIQKKDELCLFYTRFGKCTDGPKCKYLHDPTKVAVCRKFLKGECSDKDCPLSHKVSQDKMPVCIHFLKGVCIQDPCPYRHVKVNNDAGVCPNFLKGYCHEGDKCKLNHVYICPQFQMSRSCDKGDDCKLPHSTAPQKKRKLAEITQDQTDPPELDLHPDTESQASASVIKLADSSRPTAGPKIKSSISAKLEKAKAGLLLKRPKSAHSHASPGTNANASGSKAGSKSKQNIVAIAETDPKVNPGRNRADLGLHHLLEMYEADMQKANAEAKGLSLEDEFEEAEVIE